MAQGNLVRLIQQAKEMLITDPNWYKSFRERPNTLESTIQEISGGREDSPAAIDNELYKSAAVLARMELVSKWMGPVRQTQITVTPSKEYLVNTKYFNNSTRKALQKFLSNTDWANQKGSDSPVQAILKDLSKAVKNAGGTPAIKTPANRRSGKTNTVIRRGELAYKLIGEQASGEFDTSLISLINAKLPPAVRDNMGGDALHNRTGRFSESARVVGVERTPRGYPRILYTYQRAPYDVFDPVIGAAPWATPGRDPKRLIDKSIRDIARDMAIGRFYTRRA